MRPRRRHVTIVLTAATATAACGDNLEPGVDAAGGGAPSYSDPAIQAVLDLPAEPLRYEPEGLPAHFTTPDVVGRINTPADNPITDAGATLGRVLFHDVALSSTSTIACASCHHQDRAMADASARSHGFEGGLTGRNSMSLINVRYYAPGKMFWDERATSVEHQVLMPIQDPVEMGLALPTLVERLTQRAYYPPLFALAFGTPEITSDRIARALAQYVRAIVSYRSRYDTGLSTTGNVALDFPAFTAAENLGKALFFRPPNTGRTANCAGCHVSNMGPPGPPGNLAVFWMDRPRNNGLRSDTTSDQGAGNGTFKSPSLRDVALTAPYMHDGSLATLRAVVEHYNAGVQPHPNLDPRLRGPGGQPQQLGLTTDEIDAVVAFLGTLTDPTVAEDVRFASPFR